MDRPTPDPVGPGQESAWDYPRPPVVHPSTEQVEVVFAGETIAVTLAALRVLETSHPPVYYLPPDSVFPGVLRLSGRTSYCEFKGTAHYLTARHKGQTSVDAAWTYLDPSPGYEALKGYVAFYPAKVELCVVGLEPVQAQPGGFYGGWITSRVAGPFKGGPGTEGW
ncbi:MAG TPA: DUF427 domain-containing protein [Acidimicrobiales bacterium]|nr:DUF427 domain-containing protein [Acidimicrobiales bacterium]